MIAFRYQVDFKRLKQAVQESGVSVAEFSRRAGLGRDTWATIRAGQGFVSGAVGEKLKHGLKAIGKGEDALLILTPMAKGSVKILGDGDPLRRKLREAAQSHGFTSFTYLDRVFGLAEDPLKELEEAGSKV